MRVKHFVIYIYLKEVCFPIDLRLEVILRVKNDILKVPVEIVRVVKSGDNCEGMGVKL